MSDYKAILSGQSWNALSTLKVNKKPVFLTYTFNGLWWGTTKFDSADQSMARQALKMWGDTCGIRFIEVKGKNAELKFQWKREWGDFSARAEFPELTRDTSGDGLVRDYSGGSIYLNDRYRSEFSQYQPFKLYILLHEIGHALGLKHPFHTMDHNGGLLRPDLDHVKNTVMSYTGGDINMQRVGLGPLDIQAIQALYGSPSQDGKQVAKWSWSNARQTLTQVGKSKADVIHGVAVKDIIKGGNGNDKIYGFDGNDILYGQNGNDFLSGSDGKDTLYGDLGNDVLRGGHDHDKLYGGAGNDALKGSDGNDVLDGGDGNDILEGGDDNDFYFYDDNNDTLKGGTGSDTLKGGVGNDQFVFDTWFNGVDDVDQIVDFDGSDDKIVLSSAIFSTLTLGTLPYEAFVEGAIAVNADDRIIFNDDERSLSYDPDGNGSLGAVCFAKFAGTVSIYNYYILVI